MSFPEVKELVRRAREGSAESYDALIRRYSPGLFGYLYRCVGNRTQAEDLLQDVLLRMVRGLRTYREREKFEVWLYRLAHNRVVDHWRKHRAAPISDCAVGTHMAPADDLTMQMPGSEPSPSAGVEAAEEYDRLQWAIEQLTCEQRETILLRYFSGLRFAEIAKLTHCPIGTALARAHRGLGKLRSLLTEKEKEDG